MKRHWLRKLLTTLLIILVLAVGVVWLLLRASLPWLDGQREMAGLNHPVTIQRDGKGSVTVTGRDRLDLARATGYVHAQDRFFQMDLLRRASAGELAALFGGRALDFDRQRRLHRMRPLAQRMLQSYTADQRAVLEAYSAGVNDGLNALRAPPFEYLLLRERPQEWLPEDSLLSALSMYFTLQAGTVRQESQLAWLRDCLPSPVVDFLLPRSTEWDAPLEGAVQPPPPLPTPDVFNTADLPVAAVDGLALSPMDALPPIGSNNWAVGGGLTEHGAALVADDMHLGFRLPHIWYHLRLIQNRAAQDQDLTDAAPLLDITGVSLPGLPFVLVGSNRQIAWGFTNSYGDFLDLIPLRLDPQDPTRYRTSQGYRTMELLTETIQVKGAEPVQVTVRQTHWGPVIHDDHQGRPVVWRWVAHETNALSLSGFRELERTLSVAAALTVAQTTGMPGQNFVVGDRDGNIGWTIIGRIPRRVAGFDGRRTSDWSSPDVGWDGWLAPSDYPQVVNPVGQRIWTANGRVAGGEGLRRLGDGGYALGARAGQIRDRLQALSQADEADMLAIQLDDEARFLSRWRRLLLAELDTRALSENTHRQGFREAVLQWAGRAAVDDVGYRLVREFRDHLRRRTLAGLTAHCPAYDQGAGDGEPRPFTGSFQAEGPLWQLVTERPQHMLPPGEKSWRALLLNTVDQVIAGVAAQEVDIEAYTWGRRNRLHMTHPLSDALPLAGRWLRMPAQPLPGDRDMPRVQAPGFGASQRMAVAPGFEEQGYLQLPGGQSGHPLSPFFSAGHDDWVLGKPTPFLPGATQHELTLLPPVTDGAGAAGG